MKTVVSLGSKLSNEERNLLSVAYKNVVGSRRSAWRAISAQREKGKCDEKVFKLYMQNSIEKQLDKICFEVIVSYRAHTDKHLLCQGLVSWWSSAIEAMVT